MIDVEIKKINVDNVESGLRAITIKTSEKNIETPNRSIVTAEMNKIKGMRNKSEIPASPLDVVEENFPWQIYQASIKYDKKVRDNLKNENGLSRKISSTKTKVNLPKNTLSKDESKNVLKMLYPKINLKDEISTMDMTMLLEIQLKTDLDIITIPEPVAGCSYEDFVKNISDSVKFLEDLKCEKPIMPIIDIKSNMDRFKNKINYLQDQYLNSKKDFKLLGISCRIFGSDANLHYLRNISNSLENFWVHGFGAYRNQPGECFYNPHAANIWGIDTISVSPQGFNPAFSNSENDTKKDIKLRSYDGDDWGIYRGSKEDIQNHLCDCDGCRYFWRTTENFQNSLDVHEAFKSYSEISGSRKNILEDDYSSLVKNKSNLKNYYESNVKDI